jgi:hypothetical protein
MTDIWRDLPSQLIEATPLPSRNLEMMQRAVKRLNQTQNKDHSKHHGVAKLKNIQKLNF